MLDSPRFWKLVPVGLLLMSLMIGTVTVVLATQDPSFRVEENYYQRGLDWDQTMAERERSNATGWAARLVVHQGELELRLEDRAGLAVVGCEVQVLAYHNGRPAERFAAPARSGAVAGSYLATLPFRRAGLWVIRYRAEGAAADAAPPTTEGLLIGEQRLMLR